MKVPVHIRSSKLLRLFGNAT